MISSSYTHTHTHPKHKQRRKKTKKTKRERNNGALYSHIVLSHLLLNRYHRLSKVVVFCDSVKARTFFSSVAPKRSRTALVKNSTTTRTTTITTTNGDEEEDEEESEA